ncbi:MAG TPA: MFS transporter [Solirubrobacteraceae bacterium]|nr:MFS transporter [Solirubrobacteraceae bacterium]
MSAAGGRTRGWVVALAVGVVLADSSIVTLGLPDMLRAFDVEVAEVAWVLTSFNLVLALAALPAAALVRRGGTKASWRLGIVVFAAASLACAVAPNLGVLVAARCAQALGGAAVLMAALAVLVAERGRHEGARIWGAAGIVGAAVGPALGGALTQLISWEAIFAAQVPLVLAVAVPLAASVRAPADRPEPAPLAAAAALALVSAALTAALFLLVILITEGWRRSPLEAAAIVSVMALAAIAAAPIARLLGGGLRRAVAGSVALAGGLAALGLLPGAAAQWTIAPQILLGLGLGLALAALIERSLGARQAPIGRGAWTIGARHAGVVIGLLVLTPVFTADLEQEQVAAQRAGSAHLLDARLSPALKIQLADAIAERIERAGGRLPNLRPAFDELEPAPEARPAYDRLEADLADEVRRAATHAFSRSFLLAAGLALLALVPIALAGPRLLIGLPQLGAAVAAVALVATYLALGGGSYKPLEVRDPCKPRQWRDPRGLEALAEQVSLSALDGAACRLRVTREDLAIALSSAEARRRFIRTHRITDRTLADALRSGLLRAVAEAERADALSPSEASFARSIIERLPVDTLIDAVRGGTRVIDALRGGGSVLDALGAGKLLETLRGALG